MIRVYAAGAYSANNILQVARNIKNGLDWVVTLMEEGLYVHNPWGDWSVATRKDLPMEYWLANGIAWLQVSDAVFLVPGWEESKGTQKEIEEAKLQGIPVFEDLDELLKYAQSNPNNIMLRE